MIKCYCIISFYTCFFGQNSVIRIKQGALSVQYHFLGDAERLSIKNRSLVVVEWSCRVRGQSQLIFEHRVSKRSVTLLEGGTEHTPALTVTPVTHTHTPPRRALQQQLRAELQRSQNIETDQITDLRVASGWESFLWKPGAEIRSSCRSATQETKGHWFES